MVTSEQVARLAGVSRATVSRALNGSARVSEEARKRINAAIEALGYEPDMVARSLVRQRSSVIALSFFPENDDLPLSHLLQISPYFYFDVLQAIEQEALSLGYDLLLPSRPHSTSPQNYVRSLQTRRVAGVVMLHATRERVQALIEAELPAIFIDCLGEGEHATYVKSDNLEGARQATEYLLALGHRKIALLMGKTSDAAGMERLLGCQQALGHAGIMPSVSLVRQSGWTIEEAYAATREFLAERHEFSAIVAGSDMIAIGTLRALNEQGLRVPEDVSLIGFDDIELVRYTNPPLTTVRQDRQGMGRGAVQRLLDLIEGTAPPAPLVLPTELVVRQSTAPAR